MRVRQRDYLALAQTYAVWGILGLLYSIYGFDKIFYYTSKQVKDWKFNPSVESKQIVIISSVRSS